MSQPCPVLILAGTSRVVVAIARCLNRHGIAVDVAQSEAPGLTKITSHAIRKTHRLPPLTKRDEFLESLNTLVDTHGYDTLIPTTDESLVAIAPLDDILRQKLYPGCPSPAIVNTVLDKRLTLEAAIECGISVPREYQIRSLAELEGIAQDVRFPLIAKPANKVEEPNFALRYFHTAEQLRDALLSDPSVGFKHLFQEYCPGYGVGVEILIWDEKIHAVFQHRRLKELPSTGGVSVLSEAQSPDPRLLEISTRLLRRLHWQGVAMVEFRFDPTSARAVLMEVNGRYWGSLPLSVNAGVEFPYYEWQLAHGAGTAGPMAAYTPGFRTIWRVGDMMRFLALIPRWRSGQEHFSTLAREARRLIIDVCSLTSDALWQWRDPKPALLEFRARIVAPVLRPGNFLKILPAGLARQVKAYRYYGLRDGLRYSYLLALYAAGLRGRKLKFLAERSASFLFICSGNIIRSPMAAALLRRRMTNGAVRVESAGLFANPSSPADLIAILAARESGVSLADHRSSPLTARMVAQADIIFVMDHLNEAVLLNRFPQAAVKTFLLGACRGGRARRMPPEIPDPYGQGLEAVRASYRAILDCTDVLTEWLAQANGLAFPEANSVRAVNP